MATEGTSYQSGAGGKFRKKPLKKAHTTPYDRPPKAFRNPNGGDWVTKMVVDPASKLINASAQFLFSSLFRKRLGPPRPLPSTGANQESADTFLEKVVVQRPEGDQEPKLKDNGKLGIPEEQALEIKDTGKEITTDCSRLSELELMLKQKTFTRSEVDRLTRLLLSRTVESNGDGERSTDFPQDTVSDLGGNANFAKSSLHVARNESYLDNHRFPERLSIATVSSKALEEDIASPAELAKAYMGNKSKVSPSVPGLRSQAMREDSGALYNSPFTLRSPAMSLVQKVSVHNGVLENGFMTPRSRGRSALYSMARTPYSRSRPTASHKGNSSIYGDQHGPSSSSTGFARELVARSISKDLALKRRSSVLEEEFGSVGPIRRLRQKTNLSTPNNTSLSIARSRTPFTRTPFTRGTGIAPNGTSGPSSSSKTFKDDEDNRNIPGTSYTPVPSQSQETARKILQQLEKLTPKEKRLEDKVVAPGENSPNKSMPNTLNGQAPRSLEGVDSSRILQGAGYGLNYSQKGLSPDGCEASSSQRGKNIEENGPKSSNISHGSVAPPGTINGPSVLKDTIPAFSFSGSAKKPTVTQSAQKKWGFQLSANEDDETRSRETAASAKLDEGSRLLETSVVDSKKVPVEEDKAAFVSEFKSPAGPIAFEKPADLGPPVATRVVDKNPGSMFSAASAASTSFPSIVSASESTFTKNIPDKQPNAPPLFNFGAKVDDKVPFVGGSFSLKSAAPAEAKHETANSLASYASGNSVNGNVGDIQKLGETVGKPESLFLLPQSTSALTSNLFIADSKPNCSNLSNGSLNSTNPSVFSSSVPVLSTINSGNQAPPNPFSGFTFSTTNNTAATTSATSSSLSAPAFVFGSTPSSAPSTTSTPTLSFNAGSSFMAPSTCSTVSTTSTTTEKEINTATSSPMVGPGSSIFGFSAGSTSANTQSVFGTSSGTSTSTQSVFGTSSGTSTSTQSVFVFGSSATSPTPFTSGSSVFGSSTSSVVFGNTTSSGFVFGNTTSSSSLFSSLIPSFDLTTTAPSSTGFSFSAQSPAFGSSTGAASSSSVFSFSSTAQSQPVFGNSVVPAFVSQPGGNDGDQMAIADDSMAEDVVQVGPTPAPAPAPAPSLPTFGQPPSPPFMFGSTATSSSSSGVNPFQFGVQQSQPVAQNPNPFQSSGSVDFGGGSSFSLGSGGGDDKSGRRIVRIKRKSGRK